MSNLHKLWGYDKGYEKPPIPGWVIYVLYGVALVIFLLGYSAYETHKATATNGERLYLTYGSIYAFKSDPKREYYVNVSYTLHMSRERYEDLVFFDTEAEAQAAGYKASEGFAEDMECVKTGLDWYDCEQQRKQD